MSKASQFARVNYEMYGPQKGYGDPTESLHTLAKGLNDILPSREFKKMKLNGTIENGSMTIKDTVSSSEFSAFVIYRNGQRFASGSMIKVEDEVAKVIKFEYPFDHYCGGIVAHKILSLMRGDIVKEEPIRGDSDLTVYEASKFLGITENKVRSLQGDPYGPPWYKENNRIRFPQGQLARWKAAQKEPK